MTNPQPAITRPFEYENVISRTEAARKLRNLRATVHRPRFIRRPGSHRLYNLGSSLLTIGL